MKIVPAFVIGVLVGLSILAMFIVPSPSNKGNNASVVTPEVKAIEGKFSLLKGHIEAQRTSNAFSELAGLENQWQRLKEGLSMRGLDESQPSLAFEQSLTEAKEKISQDKGTATQALKSLTSSFAQVKADLRGTVSLEPWRFSFTLGGFLLIWVALVLLIPRLSERLSVKQ